MRRGPRAKELPLLGLSVPQWVEEMGPTRLGEGALLSTPPPPLTCSTAEAGGPLCLHLPLPVLPWGWAGLGSGAQGRGWQPYFPPALPFPPPHPRAVLLLRTLTRLLPVHFSFFLFKNVCEKLFIFAKADVINTTAQPLRPPYMGPPPADQCLHSFGSGGSSQAWHSGLGLSPRGTWAAAHSLGLRPPLCPEACWLTLGHSFPRANGNILDQDAC